VPLFVPIRGLPVCARTPPTRKLVRRRVPLPALCYINHVLRLSFLRWSSEQFRHGSSRLPSEAEDRIQFTQDMSSLQAWARSRTPRLSATIVCQDFGCLSNCFRTWSRLAAWLLPKGHFNHPLHFCVQPSAIPADHTFPHTLLPSFASAVRVTNQTNQPPFRPLDWRDHMRSSTQVS
jgi:hypothetical protein